MKKIYSILFFSLLVQVALSQTGTITIAKPPALKKDTAFAKPHRSFISGAAAMNYTFKGNKKPGFEISLSFRPNIIKSNRIGLFVGIQYSIENQYFQLSPFNIETGSPTKGYLKSENRSDNLKIPIQLKTVMNLGYRSNLCLSIGISPEYLLRTRDEHGRLHTNDFNRYNLAGFAGLGINFKRCAISLSYSKDIFENLKDNHLYNEYGNVIGSQKSRTNLVSFSIAYWVHSY